MYKHHKDKPRLQKEVILPIFTIFEPQHNYVKITSQIINIHCFFGTPM